LALRDGPAAVVTDDRVVEVVVATKA